MIFAIDCFHQIHYVYIMNKIQTYSNYREFLKEYFEERKKKTPSYSYRTFCLLAGIKSPSLFKEIVKGKRNLTRKTMAAFVKGLKLREPETKFFMALVNFNQAKTEKEKQLFLEQMRGHSIHVEQKLVPVRHYEYYSKWYHSAIRELACAVDWKEDFAFLARTLNPRIKTSEARQSIKLLMELGFIEKRADGRYHQKETDITTGSEVMSLAVRKLNHELAEKGQEAIEKFAPNQRDISSIVMGMSEKGYRLIKTEIQEFKHRIIRIAHEDTPTNRVYNINVQLYPLTDPYDPASTEIHGLNTGVDEEVEENKGNTELDKIQAISVENSNLIKGEQSNETNNK